MSDEAHFYLTGHVNKQNCRYWSKDNPSEIHERPLHSARVTVWCAVSSQGIIGPYFFENQQGTATTVTADAYVQMLQFFVAPELRKFPQNCWFQQDGASAHFALIVRSWLDDRFPNKWIGRGGAVSWPPRLPDLTPMDFYFWGHLKSMVFTAPYPTDIEDLKQRIVNSVQVLRCPLTLQNVRRSFSKRVELCIANNGGLFEHVL